MRKCAAVCSGAALQESGIVGGFMKKQKLFRSHVVFHGGITLLLRAVHTIALPSTVAQVADKKRRT